MQACSTRGFYSMKGVVLGVPFSLVAFVCRSLLKNKATSILRKA